MAFELYIHLSAALAVFTAMALWALVAPRRRAAYGRGARWPSNLGIVLLDTLVLRVAFPSAAVGMAVRAEARCWGRFDTLDWLFLAGGRDCLRCTG